MTASFEFVNGKLPVTSVCVHENYLFIGFGRHLKAWIYENDGHISTKPIHKTKVFKSSSIHNIKVLKDMHDEDIVLCTGAKSFAYFSLGNGKSSSFMSPVTSHTCTDWILDIDYCNKNGNHYLVLVLAHNSIVLFNTSCQSIEQEIHCSEKCILYSAKIINSSSRWNDMYICGGTVFNQVVIWKPSHIDQSRVAPLDYIAGHNGVIFAIEYQPHTQILFSASDDRSIRAIKYKLCSEYTRDESLKTCAVYGHEGRIWAIKAYYKDTENNFLLSVAEDGFCLVWKIISNEEKGIEMSISKRLSFGSNNLSLAVNSKGIFGVGNIDGSVRILQIDQHSAKHETTQTQQICIDSVNAGSIKTVHLLDGSRVLCHTDTGLLCMHVDDKWIYLCQFQSYSSYSCLKVSPCKLVVAIGNIKGNIILIRLTSDYKVETTKEFEVFCGKVFALTWSSDEHLFASGPRGEVKQIEVKTNSIMCNYQLPNTNIWHTCSLLLSPDRLLIGDRRGSLHLFSIQKSNKPLTTLRCIHGKNGVTSLNKFDSDIIISTGRDGTWKIIKVVGCQSMQILLSNKAAQGMDWIDNFHHFGSVEHGDLYMYGFHANKFVVWSSKSGDCLFTLECGGGHRSWSFDYSAGKLAYLKAGVLNLVKIPQCSLRNNTVSSCLHSQQIQSCCILNCNEDMILFATTSDDTKIKISACGIKDDLSEMRVIRTLDDHNSNVRCVRCLKHDDVITMVTCGSKSTVTVYQINDKDYVGTSIRKLCQYKEKQVNKNCADVRFMALDFIYHKNQSSEYTVAVARSDGKIEIFTVNSVLNRDSSGKTHQISSLGKSEQYNNCFLTVRIHDNVVYGGSTNGCVYMFDIHDCSLVRIIPHMHQSGINSLLLCQRENGGTLLVTGGDDNCVSSLLLSGGCDEVIKKETQRHSGQVTSLCWLENRNEILSASVDQRVVVSKLAASRHHSDVTIMTSVSDVSCADVKTVGDDVIIAMAGCGIEFYKL